MKILFMGTPDFAKESLEALYNSGHTILGVVTNPDKPKGRGLKMIQSPVKEFAISRGLNIYQPSKISNNTDFIEKINSLNPEIICVVAYGKILPKEILDIPEKGCINVHGSLLPKYRGAAPIQWAIINGEKYTGITTMYMDIGMDTGDIILRKKTEINDDETTGELWTKLSKMGAELLVETISLIEQGKAPREKQSDEFSMAPMLDKSIAKIDWTKSSTEIKNLVRGLNPIMGAYTLINNQKLKLWKVEILSFKDFFEIIKLIDSTAEKFNYEETKISEQFNNGDVIIADQKIGLFLKAKDGIIKPTEVQAENAKKMNTLDFLRGRKMNFNC